MGNRKVYIDFVDGNGYIDVSNFVKYDTFSIQESAFNDTFHAAQNTCSFSVIYDASIYTKLTSAVVNLPLRTFDLRENAAIHTEADQPILTENNMRLLVESSIAVPVFAGHIPPQSSREYNGILDNIIVKINATDDLDLFDIPVGDIIYANCAVMNPTDPANSIVHKLAFSAGWSSSMVGEVSIPTIIARFAPSDAEATVRSVLDTLLFEYGYTLFLDEANKVLEQRRARFQKALPYAEKLYANDPNNKEVVSLLKGMYMTTQNTAKYNEFKAKETAMK